MKQFSIIVAFDSKYGIGKKGHLPWKLSADLKRFKEITTSVIDPARKNAVIMGRRTWDSLPERYRPLPGRLNAVISAQTGLNLPSDVLGVQSLEQALDQLSASQIENIFVIGGSQIFALALEHPLCQKLYVTHIQGDFGCDTFSLLSAVNSFLSALLKRIRKTALPSDFLTICVINYLIHSVRNQAQI